MISLLMAARFMYHQQTRDIPVLQESSIVLPVSRRSIHCTVFQKVSPSEKAPCIMVIGGMSVYGSSDERLVILCRSFAAVGFRVFHPALADIEKLKITSDTITDIREAIMYIAGDADLCPSGKIALFAPSFSGGMLLVAASNRTITDIISAICTVGAFCDAHTTLESLMNRQEMDEYGRLIIMKNFIHHSIGKNLPVMRALDIAIKDNGYQREKPELPKYLELLSTRNRNLFTRLREDPRFRMRHWKNIYHTNSYMSRLMNQFSVSNYINKIKSPVVLIHGRSDNVIPASESKVLYEKLVANNSSSTLCVTSLIGHGEAGIKPLELFEVFRLIGAFGAFFRYAYDGNGLSHGDSTDYTNSQYSRSGLKKKRGA